LDANSNFICLFQFFQWSNGMINHLIVN
jgi:hypothetical protein